MPAVTSRMGGTPMRLVAELLAMPTTDRSCYVPSPRSPVSGPISGRAAKGMRFCVRTLHALVRCSLDGGETEGSPVGGCLQCVLSSRPSLRTVSARAPFLQFFPCSPSVTRSVLFPRPAGTARLCFTDCGAWVSRNGKMVAPQPVPYGFRFPENLLCIERKKHFPDPPKKRRLPLGAGHLASLRARVSRCSSGQKPTWRKTSWHSTKTPSA